MSKEGSVAKSEDKEESSNPRVTRFNASLLVLLSIGIGQLFAHSLLPSTPFIAQFLIIFIVLFGHEWNGVHGSALTRHIRAYFDVANVLETYQPRARTMGHLYQPEPPTPGVVSFGELPEGTQDEAEKNKFNNARDSHYANMFQHAMQMAAEMEAIEKAAASPSHDEGKSDRTLTPADPSKDKKVHEEKKKKEREEYKKQLEKPFNC